MEHICRIFCQSLIHKESLNIFSENISRTQDFLKREILIENPSFYLEYSISTFSETEFLTTLVQKTGAKILLDVNNIFVSCSNHGWNTKKYIEVIPDNLVREIHLAGHSVKEIKENKILRIDTHDNFVCKEVWELYEQALQRLVIVNFTRMRRKDRVATFPRALDDNTIDSYDEMLQLCLLFKVTSVTLFNYFTFFRRNNFINIIILLRKSYCLFTCNEFNSHFIHHVF